MSGDPRSNPPHSQPRRSLVEIFESHHLPQGSVDDWATDAGSLFMEIATQRAVLTGPPSSGKTTTTDFLEALGVDTLPEAARLVLRSASEAGYETEEIFDPDVMIPRQTAILHAGLQQELPIPPQAHKVMDRSCLDVIPFSHALGLNVSAWMRYAEMIRYRQVIYLEPLPLVGDKERQADKAAAELRLKVDRVSRDFWSSLGYQVQFIPAYDQKGEVLSFGARLGLVAKALGFRPSDIWRDREISER